MKIQRVTDSETNTKYVMLFPRDFEGSGDIVSFANLPESPGFIYLSVATSEHPQTAVLSHEECEELIDALKNFIGA